MAHQEKANIEYITVMSVVSALAVLGLHTNGVFWDFSKQDVWFSANVMESVLYFAVPVFFMISGVTLMDFHQRYDLKTYAVKRVQKTVIPFLFWSLVGGILVLRHHAGEFFDQPLVFLFNGIFGTQFVGIYWFFIPLFCVYLSLPLFSCIPESRRVKVFCYILAASLLFDTLIPFIIKILDCPLKYNVCIFGGGVLGIPSAGICSEQSSVIA